MKFLKKINNLKTVFSEVLFKVKKDQKIFFRIVNIYENTIELQVKGKTASIKKQVFDIIYESHIISSLSSLDACTLGVFYGFNLKKMGAIKNVNYPLLCINNEGKYRLHYEAQDGKICFINIKTKEETLQCPIDIAKDYRLIDEFDPTQACYIGILAGLRTRKMEKISKTIDYNKNVVPLFKDIQQNRK